MRQAGCWSLRIFSRKEFCQSNLANDQSLCHDEEARNRFYGKLQSDRVLEPLDCFGGESKRIFLFTCFVPSRDILSDRLVVVHASSSFLRHPLHSLNDSTTFPSAKFQLSTFIDLLHSGTSNSLARNCVQFGPVEPLSKILWFARNSWDTSVGEREKKKRLVGERNSAKYDPQGGSEREGGGDASSSIL